MAVRINRKATQAGDLAALVASAQSVHVSDLVYPLTVPHRGAGALIFPAGPIEIFRIGYEQGWTCLDGGDFRLQRDGSFLNAHNPDLATDIGYTQSAFDLSAFEAKQIPLTISSFFLPAPTDNYYLCTAEEVLRNFGGKTVLAVEIKTDGAGAFASPHASGASGQAFANLLVSNNLTESVIVSAASANELYPCIAAGIETMIVPIGDQSGAPAIATNQALYASGVRHIALDISANATSVVATYKAIGFRVWGFTVRRQYDQALWLAAGADALYSDDPLYTQGTTAKYRRTTDTFATGIFPSGMIPADEGTLNRGAIQNGRWFPKPGKAVSLLGQFCPVASPTNFTLNVTVCFDNLGSDSTRHADIVICAPDDRRFDAAVALATNSGYIVVLRPAATSQIQTFKVTNGTTNSINSTNGTALVAPLTLTAGLTSGAAITSLSVSALAANVPSGTQFMLPTGQLATTSALALSGATSVSITSLTPSAAVVNGTSLPQAVRLQIQVTSNALVVTRLDTGTTTGSLFDSTHRGTYIHAGQNDSAGASGLQVSFCDISIT